MSPKNKRSSVENEEEIKEAPEETKTEDLASATPKPAVAPAQAEDEKLEEEVQLVIFKLGNEEYGVDIHDVREIIKIPEITQMPNAPIFIDGIINLRGKIVVVINLLKRFGDLEEQESKGTHIIIAEVNGSSFGILVSAVSEVLTLSREEIRKSPGILSTKIHTDYISGIGIVDEGKRLLILLDLPKILSEKEMAGMADLTKSIKVDKPKAKKKKVELSDAEIVTLLKEQAKRSIEKGESGAKGAERAEEEAYEEKKLREKGEEMAKEMKKPTDSGGGAQATIHPEMVAEIVKQVMAAQK